MLSHSASTTEVCGICLIAMPTNKCTQCTFICCKECLKSLKQGCPVCKKQTHWVTPINPADLIIRNISPQDQEVVLGIKVDELNFVQKSLRLAKFLCMRALGAAFWFAVCMVLGVIGSLIDGNFDTIQTYSYPLMIISFTLIGVMIAGFIFLIFVCCSGCLISCLSLGTSSEQAYSV